MTSRDASDLYALRAEPRCVRAGETVAFTFRTRNLAAATTPNGVVRFALDPGLTALDATDVAFDGAAPGDEIAASVRATVPRTCDDRTVLAASAQLVLGENTFASNACSVVVRSRPVLDGDASGAFVDALAADAVRVRAIVVNEGDGPARDVRLTIPVPPACERIGAIGDAIVLVPLLAPGARCEGALEARIVRSVRDVRCERATVACANAPTLALASRTVVVPAASVVPADVAVTSTRRRVDVAFAVRNDGWAEARDVRVAVHVPSALRTIDGSVLVDGVPAARGSRPSAAVARVEREPGGCGVAIASVRARSRVPVHLSLCTPVGGASGEIVIALGEHVERSAFATPRGDGIGVHVVDAPAMVQPGACARVGVVLTNDGDEPVTLACGPDAKAATVAPCSIARMELDLPIPDHAADGEFACEIVANDAAGERARATWYVHVRRRERAAAAVVAEPSDADDGAAHARVAATLRAPERIGAATSFTARLDIDVHDAAERVRIRAPIPDDARYALGSCRLDGIGLADRAAGDDGVEACPLAGPGVELCAVGAGTRIAVEWSLSAMDAVSDETSVTVRAELTVDDRACEPIVHAVRVLPRAMLAVRSSRLPFYVVGCGLVDVRDGDAAPPDDAASPATGSAAASWPVPDAVRDDDVAVGAADDVHAIADMAAFAAVQAGVVPGANGCAAMLRLDDERIDVVRRLHLALRGDGLVAHLFAIRLFFPDACDARDPHAPRFGAVRAALDETFDRLSVKLRIPGFDVCADDIDGASLRVAVDQLFAALGTPSPRAVDAPCGSPAVLRALLGLLDAPCEEDPRLSTAIAAHVRALDGALARYDGLPLEVFDDALARGGGVALDEARRRVLDALRPYLIRVAC